MSMSGADLEDEIVSFLSSNFIASCCSVAAINEHQHMRLSASSADANRVALVVYDHMITFSRETEFIWGRKISSVTILFYLNRWLNLAWAVADTAENMSGLSVLRAVFSAVRMYAISTGNWLLSVVVLALNLVPIATNIDTWTDGLPKYGAFVTQTFGIQAVPVIGVECSAGTSLSPSVTSEACAIAADVLLLVVTWYKTYALKREASRNNVEVPLASMLLRDGTVYFLIVGFDTGVFEFAISNFGTPLSAIIISHFLLNLRQVADWVVESSETAEEKSGSGNSDSLLGPDRGICDSGIA
ncbi:hypothetical protein CERSUDRAFT_124023 [Gelatoporia subvermispora B]|uniref:DUF6533 domain-containing protein n=1 Tax=Ceriporiopsis subvermispora (strain B) TaxID=914234 RepID=M2QJ30_CERS8|nr:hypothetical protein CERSUDRAFT_124023 [Gelatoporia subvermispora B]